MLGNFKEMVWLYTLFFSNYTDVVEGEEPEGDERRAAGLIGGGDAAAGAVAQRWEQSNRFCESGRVGD